jgi:hypothetical protein
LRKHGQERINAGDFMLGEFLVKLRGILLRTVVMSPGRVDLICPETVFLQLANEVLCDGQE